MRVIDWTEIIKLAEEIDQLTILNVGETELVALINRKDLVLTSPAITFSKNDSKSKIIQASSNQLIFENNKTACILLGNVLYSNYVKNRKLNQLFDYLWDISDYEIRRVAEDSLFYFLIKNDVSWLELFSDGGLNDFSFFELLMQFSNSVKNSSIDPQIIIQIVEENFNKIKDNTYFGDLLVCINQKAKTDGEWANKCFELFRGLKEPLSYDLLPALLGAISEAQGNENIFTLLDRLIISTNLSDNKLAVICVGRLTYKTINDTTWFEQFLSVIDTEKYKTEELEILTIYAITNHFNLSRSCEKILLALSASASQKVISAVAYSLHTNFSSFSAEWYRECLFSLCDMATVEANGVILFLNMIFEKLRDNDFSLYEHCFSRLISSNNFSFDLAKVYKQSLTSLLHKDPNRFSLLISKWFNNENNKFHAFLEKLSAEFFISNIQKIEISKEYLDGIDERDFVFIIHKVTGFINNNKNQIYLLLSCLRRSPCPSDAVKFIKGIFVSHICYNYPSTIEFLQSIRAEYDEETQKIIGEIISESNKYFETRSKMAVLKEFGPSELRSKIFFEIRQKQMRASYNEPSKEGSFMQMTKKIILKGGKYWFTKQNGKYTEKHPLGTFEYSGELPRGEFIDPVGQHLFRLQFKFYQKS